jgi:murein DD-endopeptidase MepM/ murein hydrolase activator NlpD
MEHFYRLSVLFCFLVSCTPVPPSQSLQTSTPTLTVLEPTLTAIPSTATFTPVPSTQTMTPVICDPYKEAYCITNGHFLLQRPIKPPAYTFVDVTYRYASTANGTRDPHHGVEFLNKFGTPVYAAGDGIVVFAGADKAAVYSPWPNYYGNLVVIQHGQELYTLYAHLSRITVEAGKIIMAGEQLGEVGQTGVAIGSHLHFEVRRGDVENYFSTENPELWLVPNLDETSQPFGALQISVVDSQGLLVKRAEFNLYSLDMQDQPANNIYYGVTYSKDMLKEQENAAIGDLKAGRYRLVVQYNGQLLERWVAVESGKLTRVVLVVK